MQLLDRPRSVRTVLPLAFIGVLAMNVTVAMMSGSPSAIWAPFDRTAEFFSDVAKVHGIADFLRGYVPDALQYSVHSRTHPPGAVIFLYLVRRAFGGAVATAAWAAVVGTATGIVPFYLLARRLADERVAGIAAVLYTVTPSLVLFGATSMDGVFLVSLLWSTYFLHRLIARPGVANVVLAAISLTVSLMLSYVTVCVGVMMLFYAALEVWQKPRRIARLAMNMAVCGAVVVALLAAIYIFCGFNYLACLHASRHYDHYLMKTFDMSFSRYLDISFSNLIAFLIGVGFGTLVLWGKLTIQSLAPLLPSTGIPGEGEGGGSQKPASFAVPVRSLQTPSPSLPRNTGGGRTVQRFNTAALISIIAFSFAHLFTRETERIWLFFIPAAILAAACWIARAETGQKKLLRWTMGVLFGQTVLFQMFLYTVR
jgi:hypothetical protein